MNIYGFQIEPILIIKEKLWPNWSWDSSRNRWTGFHLWYMYKNEVKIKTKKEEFILSEGDTFIFDLSEKHHCTHDPEHPAGMYTVYFHCDQTAELQKKLKSGAILQKGHPRLYSTNVSLFEEALQGNNSYEEIKLWIAPVFQQLLAPAHSTVKHSEILNIRQLMDDSPEKNFSLEEMAAMAGYSCNQFIRLFKQATGFTPYAYRIRARITRAKQLLLSSCYSATQIAEMLGYSDLNHFSSQFYSKTGVYPSQYVESQRHMLQK